MVITRTPFRISFFGGGTDYPIWYKKHGGFVISTTINKYCYITTRYLPPFFRYKYRIRYTKKELVKHIHQIQHPSVKECLRFINIPNGIEMVHTSDLPAMSGLGSSSSFTVGFLNSLYGLNDQRVTKTQLAKDAIHIEQSLIKEDVGSQDQVNAAFGGFNKIVFSPNGKIEVKHIEISRKRLKELENHLLLFFTGFQRRASDIASEIIKNVSKKESELKTINQLAREAEKILLHPSNNLIPLGKLLDEHWELKSKLASSVTNPKIDEIYKSAKKAGAVGGKILGAGGGGFILFFAEPDKKEVIKKRLKKLLHVPFKFEDSGSQIIYKIPKYLKNGN